VNLVIQIPYFFPVPIQTWVDFLFWDKLDGALIFKHLETYVAVENDQILGFIQYGQPAFAWDTRGQKYLNPQISVIRQLYFDQDRGDAGEVLLALTLEALAKLNPLHAFYHIMGMRCTAHHGKLHSSQTHMENLMLANGFQLEHQNVYFVLYMQPDDFPIGKYHQLFSHLEVNVQPGTGKQDFEAHLDGEPVATAGVRYLADLTGGGTQDAAYLTWLRVEEKFRRQGVGASFLARLVQVLVDEGIHYLHTDTAAKNFKAIGLYEKVGFENEGDTRSYVRWE